MRAAVDAYHKFYEKQRLWQNTKWLGVPCWKLPFDAFIIQDIIYEIKPDYIIETGTAYGGSALFYASILEAISDIVGTVLTIDIELKHDLYKPNVKKSVRDRIKYIGGGSTNEQVVKEISRIVNLTDTWMTKNIVILDSWHSYDHVRKELDLYAPFVSVGSYMIVEDTHVSGHPVEWEWGKGPFEAVEDFLKTNDNFEVDYDREVYFMTFNPGGYLKRIK
jgi:cephalosporin hydroxylase